MTCAQLRRADHDRPPARGDVACTKCGASEPEQGHDLRRLRQPGRPADEVLGGRVPGAGHDLLGPLKVTFRLFVYDKRPGDRASSTMRDAKEEEVFFGDIPLMTEHGTFIINGTERVIVSQLHRSPGVFFTEGVRARLPRQDHSVPRLVGRVRVRPEGHALRPHRPQAQVPGDDLPARPRASRPTSRSCASSTPPVRPRLERGRRSPDRQPDVLRAGGAARTAIAARQARDQADLRRHQAVDVDEQKEIAKKGSVERSVGTSGRREGRASSRTSSTSRPARCCSRPARSSAPAPSRRSRRRASRRSRSSSPTGTSSADILVNTIRKDTHKTKNEAILEIYRRLRPGDPPTYESAKNLFEGMFFDAEEVRLLARRPLQVQHQARGRSPRWTRSTLTPEDIFRVIGYLLRLQQATSAASTTSTTSATGACARSASCSRTSSASASSAWSGRSRRRCPSTRTSTRRCRTT